MAHKLNFTDGRADFFEIGTNITAWHREGVALPPGVSLHEALEAGHLLYQVEKQSVARRVGDAWVPCTTGAVTVRTDRDIELGIVGADYSVVQNVDAFHVLEPLLQANTIRLETGGVLRRGADAFVLAQLNRAAWPQEVQDAFAQLGDPIAKYLLVRTNHSGRANASVTETDVRVVCANTLAMVEAGSYRAQAQIVHRGNATERLIRAADLVLSGIVQRTFDTVQRYLALQSVLLLPQEWERHVMDVVQVDPRRAVDFDPTSAQADAVVGRYEIKRTLLETLWTSGDGNVGDHSAWEAYNGVVQAVDHSLDTFPVRTSRVQQLLPGGRLYNIKDRVFQSLEAVVAARS
jgi:phage/plasmid-like protein (TIGR03299 family)